MNILGAIGGAIGDAFSGAPEISGPALAWRHSIGIVDRPTPEDECTCGPPGRCCGQDVWFSTYSKDPMAPSYVVSPPNAMEKGCLGSFKVPHASVLGKDLTFDFEITFCFVLCPFCCDGPTMKVFDGNSGVPAGIAEMKFPGCCGETTVLDGKDGAGRSRFTRRVGCCGSQNARQDEFDCCGWQETSWPILGPAEEENSAVRTWMTHRKHCCYTCYPQWVGYKQWPANCTQEDQLILLAMAYARKIRLEAQQRQKEAAAAGGAGGAAATIASS